MGTSPYNYPPSEAAGPPGSSRAKQGPNTINTQYMITRNNSYSRHSSRFSLKNPVVLILTPSGKKSDDAPLFLLRIILLVVSPSPFPVLLHHGLSFF
jgi:hypothetical protein